MNTRTQITRTIPVLILAAVVSLAGCATIDSTTQKLGHAVGIKNDNTASAVTGGAIGCGAGALISHFIGKSALAGCAIGGAAGAVSAVEIHRHQLEKARELAAQAIAAGAVAVVKTKTVQVANANGVKKPEETFESLTITLKPSDVRAHGAASQGLLVKTAHMADASSDPVTVTVKGVKSERTWMTGEVKSALKADTKTPVRDQPADAPVLVLSPVPNIAG